MSEFVMRLSEQWSVEEGRQRNRASQLGHLLLHAIQDYFLCWDRFSDEYLAELAAASTANLVPVLLLLVLPPLMAMSFLLAPYEKPDQGWQAQALFWLYGLPVFGLCVLPMFPAWFQSITGLQHEVALDLKLLTWILGTIVLISCFTVLLTAVTGIFPMPWFPVYGACLTSFLLPLLWWCAPAAQRSAPHFRRRGLLGFSALLAVV